MASDQRRGSRPAPWRVPGLPRVLAVALVALVALVASGCGRFGNDEATDVERDERIVSVSKQATEIIFALGAEDQLVGVDVSSVYPPEAQELPTVGYHRALSLEGLLATRPTLIVHDGRSSMGPEHVVTQLEQLDIPMRRFSQPTPDIEGAKALIREMGSYFDREARARELVQKLDADMDEAMTKQAEATDTPSVVVIHFGRASNVYLTMSRNSTAGKLIEWAGGRIAIDDSNGMVRMTSPEIIAKSDPDVILLTDFGYDRLSGTPDILGLPGVGSTRAARDGRIYRVEENDLVYLGPRSGENVMRLRDLIHRGTPTG